MVGSLKGVCAHYLRKEFHDHIKRHLWGEHFWSPSYFAASAGGVPLAVVEDENQKRPD
jgi:putative transposase